MVIGFLRSQGNHPTPLRSSLQSFASLSSSLQPAAQWLSAATEVFASLEPVTEAAIHSVDLRQLVVLVLQLAGRNMNRASWLRISKCETAHSSTPARLCRSWGSRGRSNESKRRQGGCCLRERGPRFSVARPRKSLPRSCKHGICGRQLLTWWSLRRPEFKWKSFSPQFLHSNRSWDMRSRFLRVKIECKMQSLHRLALFSRGKSYSSSDTLCKTHLNRANRIETCISRTP